MNYSVLENVLSYTKLENHDHLYMLSLHILLLLIVGIELGKATERSTIWKLKPAVLFILSFIVMISIGSSLLMLPEMTAEGNSMDFIDALFTSVSANCVTGLTVVETSTYLSLKGKVLILILIQLGGLNIIAFATYFISFYRTKVRTTIEKEKLSDALDPNKNVSSLTLIKRVIWSTLIIEFIGAIVLYNQWGTSLITSNNNKVFYSVFHSVSAFNNAGFTLFKGGFVNSGLEFNFGLQNTIAVLIIFGGLGFMVLHDLFNSRLVNTLTNRKKLHLQTKIAIYSSLVLITFGMVFFFISESGGVLSGMGIKEKLSVSFFQSVTTRTAGFNTVDFGMVSTPFLFCAIFLMFIGASSGSTGGGIKTSTFTVLCFSIFKRSERSINYASSFLSKELVKKAFRIFLYSIILIAISTIMLILTEPELGLKKILFEEISAFGTVGLSTGITKDLSTAGKTIILLNMFAGKIGPLALAQALISKVKVASDKKDQDLLIG